MLVDWNRTEVRYPTDRCIHELVEAQARRTPDAPAVEFQDERLTYAELDRQANRLAHTLRRLGVGPEDLIADPISPDGKLARIHLRPYLAAGYGIDMLVIAFLPGGLASLHGVWGGLRARLRRPPPPSPVPVDPAEVATPTGANV